MVSFTILCSALLAGVAFAQSPNTSFNQSVITTVIGEVNQTLRANWCTAQQSSCGTLCGGGISDNTCDATSLNFTCTCSSNNSAPALQYYNPTMLSFICNQALGDCLKANAQSQAQQANCKSTIVCGNSSVGAVASAASSAPASTGTASPTSSSGSGSGSGSTSPSSTASGSSGGSTSSAAAAIAQLSPEMATGMFGTALLAILGFAL
ncbi:hypothetical protein MMC10_006342 [Thelotrema lepadinum]|nr:hypothetical protein [Thelotrema lepadinum]